jgi:hypothetical protein
VLSASSLTMRLPSGATPAPWFADSEITPTIVRDGIDDVDVVPGAVGLDNSNLVLRSHGDGAQNKASHDCHNFYDRETPAKRMCVRHRLSAPRQQDERVNRCYFAVCRNTNALSICHSASFCELKCLPPL